MNIKEISKIKTKNKKSLIMDICLMYKRLLKSKQILDPTRLSLADPGGNVDETLFNKKSISIFSTIMELLPNEQKEVIERDFIKRDYGMWYMEKYSKTKYYQIKNDAMNNFLYLFFG